MSGTLQAPRRVDPPMNDPPHTDQGRPTRAWASWYEQMADKLAETERRLGVIDGSDAPAGQIGEYLTAGGSTGLSSNVLATVASLSLTAGDWDVRGEVVFHIAGAASSHYAAGIDGVIHTEIIATIPTGSGTWALGAGTVRRNVTATTAVTLSALAGFTSGTVTADGVISARRMR